MKPCLEVIVAGSGLSRRSINIAPKERNARLETKNSVRVFAGPKNRVAVVDLQLYTGEANNLCGAEDVRVDLRAVYELASGSGGKLARPVGAVRELDRGGEVQGVLDVDGDGHVELLELSFPDARQIVAEDGDAACSIAIEFCDCPC